MAEQKFGSKRGNLNFSSEPVGEKINGWTNFVSIMSTCSDTRRASWIRFYSFNQKFTMINISQDYMRVTFFEMWVVTSIVGAIPIHVPVHVHVSTLQFLEKLERWFSAYCLS